MTTKNINFRTDHIMHDCYAKRAEQLGFPTVSDYFKSLGRYDLLICKPHSATGDMHAMSVEQQTRFDHALADAYLAGQTTGGTYFEKIFKQIIVEMGKEDMAPPSEIAHKVQELMKRAKSQ